MTAKIKKHIGWLIPIAIVLIIYTIFGVTRYSEHTLFIPFTGRVLNIEAGDIASIYIHSGCTGEKVSYTEADELQDD